MTDTPPNEAAKPNPALARFGILLGTWTTVGTHPMVPGTTFHGHTTFAWLEGGAFLVMRSAIDEPGIPSGIAVIGSDDEEAEATGEHAMLYFDERGVSRRYTTSLHDREWTWWRETAAFSQRFTATIAPDGRTIVGQGTMSRNGAPWEPDLQLTYTRVEA